MHMARIVVHLLLDAWVVVSVGMFVFVALGVVEDKLVRRRRRVVACSRRARLALSASPRAVIAAVGSRQVSPPLPPARDPRLTPRGLTRPQLRLVTGQRSSVTVVPPVPPRSCA